jgi:hypothetical protein
VINASPSELLENFLFFEKQNKVPLGDLVSDWAGQVSRSFMNRGANPYGSAKEVFLCPHGQGNLRIGGSEVAKERLRGQGFVGLEIREESRPCSGLPRRGTIFLWYKGAMQIHCKIVFTPSAFS